MEILRGGVDILVATPGRLVDLLDRRAVTLSKVEIFVLDEVDQMLDLGFIHAIRKLTALLPKQRQNLFFSATMPKEISNLASPASAFMLRRLCTHRPGPSGMRLSARFVPVRQAGGRSWLGQTLSRILNPNLHSLQ